MMRLSVLILLFLVLMPAGGYAAENLAEDSLEITPLFDLRVRQEFLPGVFYWSDQDQRQWVRFRTRAGVELQSRKHGFTLRLANEHRRWQIPEQDFDWDELIIDQARYTYTTDVATLILGRQNIIWDGGFLVLEGHPLDGSRSIYMDGLRLKTGRYDYFAVVNSKRDPFVLAGDMERNLIDSDEQGMGLRVALGRHSLTAIWKHEDDPDGILRPTDIYTLGGTFTFDLPRGFQGDLQLALQQQEGVPTTTVDSPITSGKAYALNLQAQGTLGDQATLEAGGFYYSGTNDETRAFRTPWGRWPRWSELYIYTLLAEGGDGRVHVAAWENIAALRARLGYRFCQKIAGRLELMPLWAPEPSWQSRGLLLRAGVDLDLPHNLKGHLLWEALNHGDFHELPAGADETAHFIRWQLTYTY